MINEIATEKLNCIPRINDIEEASKYQGDVLLFPKEADINYLDNYKVVTKGLGIKLDSKTRDLLRIVEIKNSLNAEFDVTNILAPRTYAESLSPIPPHVSVQCILLSRISEDNVLPTIELIEQTTYGRASHDVMWVAPDDYKNTIKAGSIVYIMNRRVGGWDGSKERPVIELLGAGGHIGVDDSFNMFSPIDTVITEVQEEIGIRINSDDIKIFGGFHNQISGELVILCGVFIKDELIPQIQKYALENYEQDTDGIYLGLLEDVILRYQKDATPFAGGEIAKPTNFPLQQELMEKVFGFIQQ